METQYNGYILRVETRRNDMFDFLKKTTLSGLSILDLKKHYEGHIEFSIKVNNLQLNFLILFDEYLQKPTARIGITSPNKKGIFEKKVSGKNSTTFAIWKLVNDIYNGNIVR